MKTISVILILEIGGEDMHKRWVFLLGIIAIATLGGCSSSSQSTPKAPQKVTQKATQPTAKQNGAALAKMLWQVQHNTVEIDQTTDYIAPPQTLTALRKTSRMSLFAGEVIQWQMLPGRNKDTGYIETAVVIKVNQDLKGKEAVKGNRLVNVVLHGGFTKGQDLVKPILKAPTKANTAGINPNTVVYENAPGYRLPLPGDKVVIFGSRLSEPFEPYSALYHQRSTYQGGWGVHFGLWIKAQNGDYESVWQHKPSDGNMFGEQKVTDAINDLMKS
ncbi:hypothetical protein [Lacticaseibacillus saniviri]